MKATVLDLRTNMKAVLAALDRNEEVTLTYRGKTKGVIVPCTDAAHPETASLPGFGLWAERDDLADPVAFVRALRQDRF